jgi:hypothetical protein
MSLQMLALRSEFKKWKTGFKSAVEMGERAGLSSDFS